MRITVEIPNSELDKVIKDVVISKIKRRLEEEYFEDTMSQFWDRIDERVDAYINTEEFHEIVDRAIMDSKDSIIKSLQDRITGNL